MFALMFVSLFLWTVLGIKWYHESAKNKECATEGVEWLMTFWLIMCYTLNIIFLLVIISKGS